LSVFEGAVIDCPGADVFVLEFVVATDEAEDTGVANVGAAVAE
jgi:hypothetical protein